MKLAIFLSVLLFFNFIAPVYGEAQGGYVVRPHGDPELNKIDNLEVDNSEVETTISFWELPMWIKLAYLTGLVVGAFSLLKTLPVIVGRIKNILENIQRQRIYKYVLNNPGTNIEELSRNLRINRSTLRYHLKVLEYSGKLTIEKIGRYTRIYQNSMIFDNNQKFIAAAMRKESESKILKVILENPGINNREISKITGLDKSTVSRHIKTLIDAGLLEIKNDGKFRRYFIKENATDSVIRFNSSN
ncbi:winged helix-turn-helix transcriptional regulator [Candidatus Pyrohabitans sp.]